MVLRLKSSSFSFYGRSFYIVFFLLAFTTGFATGDTTKKPDPLIIEPSQYFEGNDGPWSSFSARVGTPPQPVRLLISTASPQTLAVLSNGCDANIIGSSGPQACAQSRGQMFNPNTSSTWRQASTYAINANGVGFEANLGYRQVALFGLESLGMGLTGGVLGNMTVAGFLGARPFYLGVFGLGTQPVNYSTLGNISAPSYITTLKDQNIIPALGWSYTAGAQYRLKKVLGQLIFGGYDTSRLIPNTASFDLAQDQDRDIVVSIQEIIGYKTSQTSLLPTPINAFIDSTDPMIWLPASAITLFESAFNLTFDKASNRYLITESQHASLVAMDPSVTFRIANSLSGGEVVNIKLPYSAFDLWLDWPFVANKMRYFPLMKADNETQYTLGRTFLQEAYLTVNHEYKNFTVSQCAWTDDILTPSVKALPSKPSPVVDPSSNGSIPIPPDGKTPSDSTGQNNLKTLPTGVIVGIIVGGIIFLVISALALWLIAKKRKARSQKAESETTQDSKASSLSPRSVNEITDPISELSGTTRAHEISDENSCITTAELDGRDESSPERQELPDLPTTAGRSELEDSPTVGDVSQRGNNSDPTSSNSSRQNHPFMQHPFSSTGLHHSNSENSHLSIASSFNESSAGFPDSNYPSPTRSKRNVLDGSERRGRQRYPGRNQRGGGEISELMGSDVPQLP